MHGAGCLVELRHPLQPLPDDQAHQQHEGQHARDREHGRAQLVRLAQGRRPGHIRDHSPAETGHRRVGGQLLAALVLHRAAARVAGQRGCQHLVARRPRRHRAGREARRGEHEARAVDQAHLGAVGGLEVVYERLDLAQVVQRHQVAEASRRGAGLAPDRRRDRHRAEVLPGSGRRQPGDKRRVVCAGTLVPIVAGEVLAQQVAAVGCDGEHLTARVGYERRVDAALHANQVADGAVQGGRVLPAFHRRRHVRLSVRVQLRGHVLEALVDEHGAGLGRVGSALLGLPDRGVGRDGDGGVGEQSDRRGRDEEEEDHDGAARQQPHVRTAARPRSRLQPSYRCRRRRAGTGRRCS